MTTSRHEETIATLRALPGVDAVLRVLGAPPGGAAAARAVLDEIRESIRAGRHAGPVPDAEAVAAEVARRLAVSADALVPRVVNATGVVLHTGLGRAPLSTRAADALLAVADGYALLEVDPATGGRRDREHAVAAELTALTGAEAATVVNNNAAALLLAMAALARERDVIVSRGQLIEIGGGFRLPDVLAAAGARLVEVGTTNRTYARDVAARLDWRTGLVLVMHTSNYRIVGFHHEPAREELVGLAGEAGVPLLEDIGSGLLVPGSGVLDDEPDASSAIAAGVDLVCFSGDKLLGGPQAGLLVGRADLVARCRRHPLFRAVRPDRLALAALGATLRLHREARHEVPVVAALASSVGHRRERAEALAARLAARFGSDRVERVETGGEAGSGSAPARPVPSWAVAVRWPGWDPERLLAALRSGTPSVFARSWKGRVALDVLALLPGDDERIETALAALEGPPGGPGPAA